MSAAIYASILSADFARLGEDVRAVVSAGAVGIHFDVMDNHFVPNLTIGADVCRCLRADGIHCPIDVHLMTTQVDNLVPMFAQSGASAVTIHLEIDIAIEPTLQHIRSLGMQVGIALNPNTDVALVLPYLSQLDQVLMMSVQPGFGGQAFMPVVYDKIRALRAAIDAQAYSCDIRVDGGVNTNNIAGLMQAGAHSFVVGSALFGADDYVAQMQALQAPLDSA